MTRDISHLAGDLTKRAAAFDRAIERGARDIVPAGAKAAKDVHLDVMRGDAGGDLVLSRVRGKGAKIGARFDVRGDSADIKALGPVPLIAKPIGAHRIGGRRRKAIAIPGVGVRASAMHPGTRGKDTWNRGREKAEPKVRTAIAKKSDEVMRKAFLSGG